MCGAFFLPRHLNLDQVSLQATPAQHGVHGLALTGILNVWITANVADTCFLKRDNDSQRFVFKTAKAASMLR